MKSSTAAIRKLRIPASPLTDSYTWQTVAPLAADTIPIRGMNGCYNKLNLVYLKNGQNLDQALLVLACGNESPNPEAHQQALPQNAVYVYKLPDGDF